MVDVDVFVGGVEKGGIIFYFNCCWKFNVFDGDFCCIIEGIKIID